MSRKTATIVAGALLVSGCSTHALAQQPTAAEPDYLAQRTIEQLDAYVMRGDGQSILELAHPDFLVILPVGIVENRETVAKTVHLVEMAKFDQRILEVRRYGGTAIVLTAIEAEGTAAGNPFPSPLIVSQVYTRDGDEWKLVQRQMTKIEVPIEVFERALKSALAE
jgi:ketosteroid isomerase-like protein